tara:strand:+ start:204 stop:2057 length:1854 start_codon:yes stop_codon:yes gene_type:complete
MNYLITNNKSQVVYDNMQSISVDTAISQLRSCEVVGVDTETTGFNWNDNTLLLLQISTKENNYIFDCTSVDISILNKMFLSDKVTKIFHNVKFDYKFLRANNLNTENVYDTMLADQVIHCGKKSIKYSLDALLDRYFEIFIDKSTRSSFITHKPGNPYTKQQLRYAFTDTEFLLQIVEKQQELINEYDLNEVVKLENQAALAFADIEYNGIYLNKTKWEENYNKIKIDLGQSMEQLDNFIEFDPMFDRFKLKQVQTDMFLPMEELRKTNMLWSSPTQVLKLMQCVSPELESVNGKVLLMHKNMHPIVSKYIKYKEQAKLCNAYGLDFYKYLHKDDKIHTSFQQILNTGRVSSRSPNMQQIPSDNSYRNAFVPENGEDVFVSSDFSSQELCIIAFGSGDPVWLNALEEGKDLHSICAELIFGKTWIDAEGDTKERKRLRTAVKAINFGLAYGMSEFKLSDTLGITVKEAKKMIKKYFTVFPAIKKFLDNLGAFGTDNGFIRTFSPYRRIRWFEDWSQEMEDFAALGSIERASKNTPIQGTGADMTKLALVMVRKSIKQQDLPVKLIMTVHDQIDTICKSDFAEEWSIMLKGIMEEAALKIITNGLLKSDTNITKQWQK